MIACCEQPAKIREQTANEKDEKPIMHEKGVDQCMALTHPVWLDLCNCRWPPARLSRRFRKVEVRQHDVPRLVQQDIFWFQVSIDKTHQVQVLQRRRHLSRIETRVALRETLPRASLQRTEEFAAHTVLHAEVEVLLGLERMVKRHDERMV